MTEKDTESRPSPEMLGGVVILLGAIPAFAIAMALKKGVDPSTPNVGGIARLATGMMAAWGKWPAFLASAGVAFIGASIFVGVIERDRVRAIVGTIVASLGLAALTSALQLGAGGMLGDATGGRLGAALGAWAGVALGLVVIGGAVWLGWLQGRVELPTVDTSRFKLPSFRLPSLPKRRDKAAAKRAKARARELAEPARLADALTRVDADLDGVSSAEANALAPDEKTLRYMEEVWLRAAQGAVQVAPMPPSPYPADVRLRGEIPPGAKPLGAKPAQGQPVQRTGHGPGQGSVPGPIPGPVGRGKSEVRPVEAGSAFTWRPDPRPMQPPSEGYGDELDPFVLGGSSFDEEDARALADAIRREGAIVAPPSPYPPGVRPLGSPRSAPQAPPGRSVHPRNEDVDAFAPSALPPRPTWEQDELTDELGDTDGFASEAPLAWSVPGAATELDEEALVEEEDELEEDELEEVDELDDDEELDAPPSTVLLEADAVGGGDDDEEEVEDDEDEEDEEDEDEEDEEEDEEDDDVAEAEAEGDEDGVDEEEADEEEDEDEDDEEAEEDEEDDDDVEDEEEADATDLEVLAATAVPAGDATSFTDDGLEYVEVDEVDEVAPTPVAPPRPAPAPAPRRAGRRQPSAQTGAQLDFGPGSERQVTLRPSAPPAPRAATLQKAGALFVHEGRVAVSLLQRQLGLEFDDACTVLDELQEAGLIGPYKGGQKRDILLTAEEWAARCATS